MKKLNSAYCLWLVCIGFMVTSNVYGQEDWIHDVISNSKESWVSYRYQDSDSNWRYRRISMMDLEQYFKEKLIASTPTVEKSAGSSFNIGQIGLGVVVGAVCVFVGNYYFSLKNKNNNNFDKSKKNQVTDTDETNNNQETDASMSFYKHDRSSELSFDKRVELLNRSLRGVEKVNLNISLIACLTQGFSRAKLEKFIKILKRSATEYNINFMNLRNTVASIDKVYPIDMSHVEQAIEEMVGGSRVYSEFNAQDQLNTAIHEAGHAVSFMRKDKFIIHYVSIVNRMKSVGRNIIRIQNELEPFTLEDYKDYIVSLLSGGVAEQVFGFDKSWHEGWTSDQIQNYSECCALSKNENISEGLADLLIKPGAVSDIVIARQVALAITKYYMTLSSDNDEGITNQVCKILEECYQKSVVLIKSCKPEVEKIAQLLMRSDIVSGDEIYNLFGKVRPLYAFEVK